MSFASGHGPGKRTSFTKAPDYSGPSDTEAVLSKKKVTPVDADYSPASANARARCIECEYYLQKGKAESDCAKVIGLVVANGTCDLYEQASPKPAPNPAPPVVAPKRTIEIKIQV